MTGKLKEAYKDPAASSSLNLGNCVVWGIGIGTKSSNSFEFYETVHHYCRYLILLII